MTNKTPIAEVASKHKMDPKALRQRLRRLAAGGKLPFKRPATWELTPSQVKAVDKLIAAA